MRGWANAYIEKLQQGETVQFRPRGNSMAPKIKSGQMVTVSPIDRKIVEGDIVLCTVKGKQWLHLVSALAFGDSRVQISNNKGHVNGWTTRDKVYGRVTKVED
jgi:phage repressor protein C with HTH and peptisase S24 domain